MNETKTRRNKMITEFLKETFCVEGITKKDIVKSIIGAVVLIGIIWGALAVGSAYEHHVRCNNGATEYCIEQ